MKTKEVADSVMKGIDLIFEQNKELSKIGTDVEYSNYVKSIFPKSKIDKIVYHGTNNEFQNFNRDFEGSGSGNETNADLGFYAVDSRVIAASFTESVKASSTDNFLKKLHESGRSSDRDYIIKQMKGEVKPLAEMNHPVYKGTVYGTRRAKVLPLLINLKNPYKVGASEFSKTYYPALDKEDRINNTAKLKEKSKNNDGIIIDSSDPFNPNSSELNNDNYVIFNSKNIHILGNKQDEYLFRKFIEKSKKDKLLDKIVGVSGEVKNIVDEKEI